MLVTVKGRPANQHAMHEILHHQYRQHFGHSHQMQMLTSHAQLNSFPLRTGRRSTVPEACGMVVLSLVHPSVNGFKLLAWRRRSPSCKLSGICPETIEYVLAEVELML